MAAGPVLKTVARPVPFRMYSHSSALGCQCIALRPPGLMVTRDAAIVLETRKLVLSAIRTEPLLFSRLGSISPSLNTYECGGLPAAAAICASTAASEGAGRSLWEIHLLSRGVFLQAPSRTQKFFASTAGGVWPSQSVGNNVLNSDE